MSSFLGMGSLLGMTLLPKMVDFGVGGCLLMECMDSCFSVSYLCEAAIE
jgi:C4-dicarboxylate transporter